MTCVEAEKSFVAEKLMEWNLEEYIPRFEREQIDKNSFLTMPKEAVFEVIEKVGPRYKFLQKRNEYLMTNKDENIELNFDTLRRDADDTVSATSNISERSVSTTSLYTSGEKLKIMLLKSVTGRYLLSQECLTSSDRKQLCQIIIETQLNDSVKLHKEDFNFWSEEIVATFKNERNSTYYIPYRGGENKRLASGKLWDKYCNLKKKIKVYSKVTKKDDSTVKDKSEEKNALLELKQLSLDDDAQWKLLWKTTHNLRDRNISIAAYYEEFPILQTPIGATLLQIDFDCMAVADPNALMKKWPSLSPKIIELATKKQVCQNLLENTERLTENVLGLRLLPFLFKPVPIKTKNKRNWKPSRQEQANGFITWIPAITDLDRTLKARLDLLHAHGLSIQPTVIAVGLLDNLIAAYVIINDVKYSFNDILSAVSFCFKSFYALNAKYPFESEVVWSFIESYIFNVQDQCNRQFSTVEEVISDLKNLKTPQSKIESDII